MASRWMLMMKNLATTETVMELEKFDAFSCCHGSFKCPSLSF